MIPCPNWIIALLEAIDEELTRIMWNVNQKDFASPFKNTGNKFKNDTFEVIAYDWDEESNQRFNFKWKDVEISWYKYLGRCTEINDDYEERYIIQMFNECIESLHKLEMEASSNESL